MADLPELKNVVLEDPDPVGPFGAKAIGEMANNGQSPAVIAAIHDAVGVWVTELPAKPSACCGQSTSAVSRAERGVAWSSTSTFRSQRFRRRKDDRKAGGVSRSWMSGYERAGHA